MSDSFYCFYKYVNIDKTQNYTCIDTANFSIPLSALLWLRSKPLAKTVLADKTTNFNNKLQHKQLYVISTQSIPSDTLIAVITGELFYSFPSTIIHSNFVFPIQPHYVLDCREYSNEYRFIRRCCYSNARLQILSVDGILSIGIYSTKDIKSCTEITLSHPSSNFTTIDELLSLVHPSDLNCACALSDTNPHESFMCSVYAFRYYIENKNKKHKNHILYTPVFLEHAVLRVFGKTSSISENTRLDLSMPDIVGPTLSMQVDSPNKSNDVIELTASTCTDVLAVNSASQISLSVQNESTTSLAASSVCESPKPVRKKMSLREYAELRKKLATGKKE